MQVPDYQRQSAQQSLPAVSQTARVGAADFINPTTLAATEFAGRALNQLNGDMQALYAEELQKANRTRSQDSLNQLQQYAQDKLYGPDGALNQRGAAVFTQENSKPLTDNVTEDLQAKYAELMDTLGNNQQREHFAQQAEPLFTHVRGQLLQHEAEQHRVYARGVNLAAIDTQANTIGLNYNDPAAIQQAIGSIHAASIDLGRLEGHGEEHGLAQGRKQASNALSLAVQSALQQGDHASASAILRHFSADMEAGDLLRSGELIARQADAEVSAGVARHVMASIYPRMQSADADRALNIALSSASGGQEAIGPDAARQAGLPWDENRLQADAGYRKALGAAAFNRQLKNFNGDLELAWAAYHAGPGPVRDAIGKAGKQGGGWLSYLPRETQAYVAANSDAYAAGEGQHERPSLQEANAEVLARLGPDASPRLQKMALDETARQFEEADKAIRQREQDGVANALQGVSRNGGNFNALPVSVRAAIPAREADSVMAYAAKVAKGEPVETDWPLYYRLKTDPGLLANTNLLALRNKLGDSEFKNLSDDQQHSRSGNERTGTRTARDILEQFMREAGVDPAPKHTDQAGAAKVGKIWSAFEQRLSDAERINGGKLSSEEIHKVAARMFTKVGVKGLLYGSYEKPAVLVDWKKDRVAIPDADRAQIIQALRAARPGTAVSEDDIFYMYTKHKGLL